MSRPESDPAPAGGAAPAPHLLVLGLGYTATRIAAVIRARGWQVSGTTRDGRGGTIPFADRDRVAAAIARATHILSSVPPAEGSDPVLAAHEPALAASNAWLGYLSSTGVYGDTRGAWVDESAPTGTGRRGDRAEADARWLALGARVLRLPGIYGPGRSALDRVREGRAQRIDAPGQVFSRIHVDDIASAFVAALDGPAGAYNIADDLPASQNEVIAHACTLLGRPIPPLESVEVLSPPARAFYSENRRVANLKARRLLGWRPRYATYRLGLRALSAITSPTSTSAAPAAASSDQR